MTLDLTVKTLLSRKIRVNSASGKTGGALLGTITSVVVEPRKIDGLTRLKPEGEGNLIQNLWNAATKFVGFIGGLLKTITFSATKIWGWVIGRIEQLKSFNWNASE